MTKRTFTLIFIALLQLTATSVCFSKDTAARQPGVSEKPVRIETDKLLEDAISVLRRINPDRLNDAEKDRKANEIDAAWKTIKSYGENGILRLKEEIKKVDTGSEKDDYFKLNAAALLWENGKLNEAQNIAEIWNGSVLNKQYNYVFYTAMDAARTRDAKVLPMLKALLKDDQGTVYFPAHAMNVQAPLTHEFVWGFYGIKGFPALNEVLQTSADPVQIRSAMMPLCQSLYQEALPKIRQLAAKGTGENRRAAIRCLGMYGYLEDYEFLIAGLRSKDPKEVWHYVYALCEFDDARAVPLLIPFLETEDAESRAELIATLLHLLTPSSFEAVKNYCETTKNTQEKEPCEQLINDLLGKANLEWTSYLKKTVGEKESILKEIRRDDSTFKKDDRKLTHGQLLAAINEWKSQSRLDTKEYGWVQSKHILAVATEADIDLLLEAKATFYGRLSDECLYDVRRIDNVVKQLRRKSYRKAE